MNPVSPKLTYVKYLSSLLWLVLLLIGFVIAYGRFDAWWWIGIAATAMLALWEAWLIPNQVKLMKWQETDDELLIAKGRFWHKFTVVPYGRIQFVDVKAGPIMRIFGLKNVVLHTASSTSDSKIKGLPAADADALRQRLTVKARERMSGL
ncbi:PH domain-containing protein [Corynebacterium breve]|uniref:PH domain-containing protein n=1 Tax=Corynebacterium breve TaxID=3049799 RepID=A0ABY8VEV0_9CORY|nr:PH domain-containing protein [Corynebacterium breve]WIM68184.1 PH domain-containing protein [Corynebacterium breve]